MKNITVYFAFLVFASCSQQTSIDDNTAYYKEAVLRTRDVYQIDKNIDGGNPASIEFLTDFPGQLIEINFKIEEMNSVFYTLNNGNWTTPPPVRNKNKQISELKIELNGVDITACLLEECNSTSCHGSPTPITEFKDNVSTENLFINLAKVLKSTSVNCNTAELVSEGSVNSLVFKEATVPNLPTSRGGRLVAQVLIYKRPHTPDDFPLEL